jgi:hypothetical protein
MDFFEHVYLECYHREWLTWAETVWASHWARTRGPGVLNPFQRIVDAFHDSDHAQLQRLEREITELKDELRREKDEAYYLRADAARCSLLSYPCG